jgi:hypothetical protein
MVQLRKYQNSCLADLSAICNLKEGRGLEYLSALLVLWERSGYEGLRKSLIIPLT